MSGMDQNEQFNDTTRNYSDYNLSTMNRIIIESAKHLLHKITKCSFIQPAQLVSAGKMLYAFEQIPKVTPDLNVAVELTSPRKWFGEHEIYHWWKIEMSDGSIGAWSCSHFYRKSTGGDNFTTMTWTINPGEEGDFND